jgi:hypothetical protein
MSQTFKQWVEEKKKDRYKPKEIAVMSGLPFGTFRMYQNGEEIKTRKTALKIHNATGISMEALGFVKLGEKE